MSGLAFAKVLPGGNTTILLIDCGLRGEELSRVSALLMRPLHLGAEQVGALLTDRTIPHLQMMGGEFCVNATRSAALILARAGKLRPLTEGCLDGRLTVSGAASPVEILVGHNERAVLDALGHAPSSTAILSPAPTDATELYCAARMLCGSDSAKILPVEPGLHLVHIPGICHLMVDAQSRPMPRNWRAGSAALRLQAGIANAPASGVVWYERREDAYRILPAVEVKATGSEHMETACGSASMAMALLHATVLAPNASSSLSVLQPSGESLRVTLLNVRPCRGVPSHAWVSGQVRLIAEGRTHV